MTHKILVIQTAFIGDVILITPLLKGIKAIYPNSDIDVVIHPKCWNVLHNNPYVHKIWNLEKKNLFVFTKFIFKIRRVKYDISVSPHSSFRSGLISFLGGIKYRIGFKRNLQQYLLTKSIVHEITGHKVNKNLRLLELLPIRSVDVPIDIRRDAACHVPTKLYPVQKNYDKVYKFLTNNHNNENGHSKPSPKILIAPGSVWFTKRWPIEKYALLTENLVSKGYTVLLSGSSAEKGINEYILHRVLNKYPHKSDYIHCTAGKFDLLDSAALIEMVDLVICNDSGTLHIANAMQTPVFAFFGPTVKSLGYFPFGDKDYVFEVDLPCRPCGSHGGRRCAKAHFKCMEMISVDQVLVKVEKWFESKHKGHKD